jgi:RsiW-degrading membrane proteinase PrsW (M82 family)
MSLYDLLAIVGVIPPFLLLWFAERFERRVREPTRGWRYRIMAASGLASIPIAWAERLFSALLQGTEQPAALLVDAYVLAAGIEELGKVGCLMLLTRGLLGPQTRYGAWLYALHSSMGFALVENVIALLADSADLGSLSTRFVLRAYMTVPMHFVAGGILGYFWALRRFDGGPIGLAGGTSIAIVIHGSFNASLLAMDALEPSQSPLRIFFGITALAIPLFGVLVLRFLGSYLRLLDQRSEMTKVAFERRQSVMPLPPAM